MPRLNPYLITLWAARGFTILYMLFLMIFSVDVFDGNQSIWMKLGGFIIHNIPVILLVFFLIFTWNKPVIAGILFMLFGIATVLFFQTLQQGIQVFSVISLPIILTGALYLASWYLKRQDKTADSGNPDIPQ